MNLSPKGRFLAGFHKGEFGLNSKWTYDQEPMLVDTHWTDNSPKALQLPSGSIPFSLLPVWHLPLGGIITFKLGYQQKKHLHKLGGIIWHNMV